MEDAEKAVMTDTYHKTELPAINRTTSGPEDTLSENPATCADTADKTPTAVNSATVRHFSAKALAALFCPQLLDEFKCAMWLNTMLHGADKRCPWCLAPLDVTLANSFIQGKRVRCRACSHWFTARTSTMLQGAQLSNAQVFFIAALLDFDITPARIAGIVGVSIDTVRIWQKRFKAFE